MLNEGKIKKILWILAIFTLIFYMLTIWLLFSLTTEINNVIRVKHLIVFGFSILFTLTANIFLFSFMVIFSYNFLEKTKQTQR